MIDSKSPRFHSFLEVARRASSSDSVVLLRGESGTGKNVLAQWLHANSQRASRGPFVTVHCPELNGDLMSSALFGHRKGAFTGAVTDATGKVDQAAGGTLFLDEIGELAVDSQARLLRFLANQSYERLGDSKEMRADVRLICATNRNLENDVKSGRFREDLFFRLNVLSLNLPALRDRQEDLLPLALNFLRFFERSHGRKGLSFSRKTERAIVDHPWPGNVRELRNAIERAVILVPSLSIEPADLGIFSSDIEDSASDLGPEILGGEVSLDRIEREHIARVVSRTPSLEQAAKVLGIDPTTLQRKRKRYGLS